MLSKSKIKDHSKCPMILWHEMNQPSLKEWDDSNMFRFEQGRVVEKIARDMFKNAIEQDKKENLKKVEYTKQLILDNRYETIFEAAFLYDNVIVQFDMLKKNDDGSFDATEVKSSASFKEDYQLDTLVQYWVATKSGIKIRNFELWHINNQSTSIELDYFTKVNIKELVLANEDRFNVELEKAKITYNSKTPPQYKVGSHCNKIECPYQNTPQCKVNINQDSVLSLPNFKKKWDAHHKEITSVNHELFDQEYKDYSEKNPIVIQSVKENKLIINQDGINKDISTWVKPFHFFDFETFITAIPVIEKQRPYEQMVVQYSNHTYNDHHKMTHSEFLHESKGNPDIDVIESMIATLGTQGSIVSYNQVFEKTRIKCLAKRYPQYADQLNALVERFVDLMDIVKDHVYHPDFMGSYSLKVVSPTLLKEYGSYSDSLIKSGSEIAQYYVEMLNTFDQDRKSQIKKALLRYCQYDTLNLFLLLKYLLNQDENLKELVELNLSKD